MRCFRLPTYKATSRTKRSGSRRIKVGDVGYRVLNGAFEAVATGACGYLQDVVISGDSCGAAAPCSRTSVAI